MVKEIQPNGHVTYTYDNNDNLISRASSLGNEITYQYDASNNVTHIAINDNGVVRITRDQSGAPVEETLSDITRKYAYTPQGLLSLQVIQSPQTRIERRYAYDVLGNMIEKKDSLKGDNYFTYDPSGRIIEHTDPSGKIKQFLHDPAGNLLKSVPNQTDASTDRMMEYDSTTYRFNAAGKLIEKTAKGDNQIFHWDGNDRLTKVQKEEGPCTQMAYDAIGRRIYKETDGAKTTFLWDGDRILADNTEETPSREFVFYPNSFEPLAIIDKDKQVYYFHNDLVGLPQEVTDSQGNVLWFATYDALGKVKSLRTNQFNNPIRMQGQYADDEIGLYYNRYRYYDPDSCSFISQDPLRLLAGTNLYRYVPNVWGWIDPLGLSCEELNKINNAVSEILQSEFQSIRQLDSNAQIGVRGSLARGTKGIGKDFAPFDPNDFDVDAFIVSDELAEFFPASKKFRDARRNTALEDLNLTNTMDRIEDKLRNHKDLKGLRKGEEFNFRIIKSGENYKHVFNDNDPQYFIIPLKE